MSKAQELKRIAIIVPALEGGGGVPAVARFVKDVVMRSEKFDVKLISLCMSSHDEASIEIHRPSSFLRGIGVRTGIWEGLPFQHVGAFLGEFEFQRYRRRRVLNEILQDCDLIQVISGSPAWANVAVGLGKPVALQVATRARVERRMRDAAPRNPADLWRKAMTQITDRLDDRALCMVDSIQVENQWMYDYAQRLNSGRMVDLRYAPPGIDTCLFHPADYRDLNTDPYILCVGRLADPRKNITQLLYAYALLPKTLINLVRLVLAGSSAPTEVFWQQADKLGLRERISFIEKPSVEELVRLYQQATVFALPSDEEGLGIVVLEAMACGVPVVSTLCGGPESIITNNIDGYLVPLNNTQAMSSRLEELVLNISKNSQMGKNARQAVKQRYDERVTGDVFINMWERLINKDN